MGVANATLDDIAERAGVSKGTIYLYFPNKEDLFRQTIRDALTSKVSDTRAEAQASPTRQLLDTVDRYWQFLNSDKVVTVNRLVTAEQSQFPELAELYATEVVVRFREELRVIIQRGIEDGEFRETDSGASARMLAALTIQNASWVNGGVAALSAKGSTRALRELTDFFLRAMAPDESAFAQADGAPADRRGLNN